MTPWAFRSSAHSSRRLDIVVDVSAQTVLGSPDFVDGIAKRFRRFVRGKTHRDQRDEIRWIIVLFIVDWIDEECSSRPWSMGTKGLARRIPGWPTSRRWWGVYERSGMLLLRQIK